MTQISFDSLKPAYKITKSIRLIELFAGIGAQAKALENLGVDFEHYRICEFDKYAVKSYNAIHGTDFSTSDITRNGGVDLGIVDVDKYTYIMTYSFPCQDLSICGKQKGMSKGGNQEIKIEVNQEPLKLRKLTPRECFRLMSFTDEDIDKCYAIGMSDSQLYKQAGNSIVVRVLEKIFEQMIRSYYENRIDRC